MLVLTTTHTSMVLQVPSSVAIKVIASSCQFEVQVKVQGLGLVHEQVWDSVWVG